jgi:hypothetical protein
MKLAEAYLLEFGRGFLWNTCRLLERAPTVRVVIPSALVIEGLLPLHSTLIKGVRLQSVSFGGMCRINSSLNYLCPALPYRGHLQGDLYLKISQQRRFSSSSGFVHHNHPA